MTFVWDVKIKTFASVCEMILRKLIKNMTGVFSRSWSILSITSMTGWSRFWARETQRPSASIPIPLRSCGVNSLECKTRDRSAFRFLSALSSVTSRENVGEGPFALAFFFSVTLSIALCLCVPNLSVAAPLAQQTSTPSHKNAPKRTIARKKSPATPAKPPVASSLAEQQLERLAHELHDHPMGMAYER